MIQELVISDEIFGLTTYEKFVYLIYSKITVLKVTKLLFHVSGFPKKTIGDKMFILKSSFADWNRLQSLNVTWDKASL